MLICSNVTELKFLSTLSSSDLPKQIHLIEFANSIMSEIYRMLFDGELPRVFDEMKYLMQSSPEGRVGDWFLYKDYTVLRVYDFTGQPYRLPSFLTPRIFALEFMRQRLLSEEEHFGAFRKSLNIKFPFKVGPFIFKGKGALTCIERLMEPMEFIKDVNMSYDPHQVISLRKQANRNKPFEHQAVEGLSETANLLTFTDESNAEAEAKVVIRGGAFQCFQKIFEY